MLAATITGLEGAEKGSVRRGADRVAVRRTSTLRDHDDAPYHVMVDDLSTTGCRLLASRHLPVGSLIQIGLSGAGRVTARVVRRRDDVHGCVFVQPLTADRVGRAFTDSVLVSGAFASSAAGMMPLDEPERWPGAVRLATVLGLGAGAWIGVVGLVRLLVA